MGTKGEKILHTVMVVSIIIVIIVLLLAVITTSKAYSYKHTVDPIDNNPYISQEEDETNKS
jgi:cell division protein FtsL